MTVTTIRIDDALSERLEKFCEQEDRSKSWAIRKAIEKYLDSEKGGKTKKKK